MYIIHFFKEILTLKFNKKCVTAIFVDTVHTCISVIKKFNMIEGDYIVYKCTWGAWRWFCATDCNLLS